MAYSNTRALNILSRTCGVMAIFCDPCKTRNQQNTHPIVVCIWVPPGTLCPHSVPSDQVHLPCNPLEPWCPLSLLHHFSALTGSSHWFIHMTSCRSYKKSFHWCSVSPGNAQFLPCPQSKVPQKRWPYSPSSDLNLSYSAQAHSLAVTITKRWRWPRSCQSQWIFFHSFNSYLWPFLLAMSVLCPGIDLCTKTKTPDSPWSLPSKGEWPGWKPSFSPSSPQARLFLKHFLTVWPWAGQPSNTSISRFWGETIERACLTPPLNLECTFSTWSHGGSHFQGRSLWDSDAVGTIWTVYRPELC